MKDYQEETVQLYLDMTKEYGVEDVRALTWGSRHTQEVRFEQLPRLFNVKYAYILDVGCGRGDLCDWLGRQDEGHNFSSYTGVDLCEHHIKYARERNPDVEFVQGSIPEYNLPGTDIAFASGLFGFGCWDWTDIVKSMIDAMWDASRVGICFNMQSEWEIPPAIHYSLDRNWNPLYWLEWVIKTKSKKVALLHDYLKGDFTIGVKRDEIST